jgi:hypothetical protein
MNPPTRSPSIKGRLRPQWCIIAAITAGYLAVAGTGIAQKPDSPPRGKPAKPPASTADAPAKTKAMKLMIPQIQFSESPLDQVLASIAAKVKELDPDEKGFLIKGPANLPDKTVTLDIRNISVWDLLAAVGELTGHHPEAGREEIVFKPGTLPHSMPAENSPIRKKAEGVRIPKFEFEKATVKEMVDYVRRNASKAGLNIIVADANDEDHYDLSLAAVSGWDALDKIALATGMTLSIRGGAKGSTDGDESIVLDHASISVEDLGVPDILVASPQYRAISVLDLPPAKSQGTLADAVASFAKGIQAASNGKLKVEFKIAPGIAKTKFIRDLPPSPAAYRFIILADFGKYEWALEGETFLLRPATKKK